ncbi:MAG TPA: hypothetical protein ENJ95_19935 [Bacteroidetes bacterium]|nr:hypothetical protein [Bacteroidota bacterium]
MRYLFLILSFTTLLSSTQPLWDLVFYTLAGSCEMSLCDGSTCSPEEEEPEAPASRQCCPSFQCCFMAFAGFSTPYSLDLQDFEIKNVRPSEHTKTLRSTFIAEDYDPPDTAFFS